MSSHSSEMSEKDQNGTLQRLLIVHLKLAELCTGDQLSEGASEEELAEQILYFHSEQSEETLGAYDPQIQHSTAEAIQFAGLCSALYSLPSSIYPKADQDSTREVRLENCSLVFQTLESYNLDIIAVAQIARRKPETEGGTPSAVAAAIQRSHQLFGLLRGRGIQARLCASKIDATDERSCIYPGMDQLYRLRKQARRLKEKKSAKPTADSNELLDVEKQIEALNSTLPINSLRHDLRIHYGAFLGEMALLSASNCGACRNVIENVPVPTPLPSGSHTVQSIPVHPDPYVIAQLSLAIKEILEKEASSNDKELPRIYAISCFVRGQQAWSHCIDNGTTISNETASLLFSYMASFQFEMQKQRGAQAKRESRPQPKRSVRPLTVAFGTDMEDGPVDQDKKPLGEGFLDPPPLSFMSALDDDSGFEGPYEGQRVWAPRIYLPVESKRERLVDNQKDAEHPDHTDARICMYHRGDYSFLVCIDRLTSAKDEENESVYVELFQDIAEELSAALYVVFGTYDTQYMYVKTKNWSEPGQEIISIDRKEQKVVLISHLGKNSKGDNKPRKSYKFSSLSPRKRSPDKHRGSSGRQKPHRSPLADGLDCRYLLASHLSLDSLLAFEDAISDVHQRRSAGSCKETGVYEACTFLPHGWMFVSAIGDHELYVLLDSSLYVTVADVQHAVARIRKELLGDAVK